MRETLNAAIDVYLLHANAEQRSEIFATIDSLSLLVSSVATPEAQAEAHLSTTFTSGDVWTGFGTPSWVTHDSSVHSGSYLGGFSAPTDRSGLRLTPTAMDAASGGDANAVSTPSISSTALALPRSGGGGAALQERRVHAPVMVTTVHCPPLPQDAIRYTCNCAHGQHGLGCVLDLEGGLQNYFADQHASALDVDDVDRDKVCARLSHWCTVCARHCSHSCVRM